MTVGQTIRALRKKRGLTQKQLGDLCGLSGAAVCEYERGKTLPKRHVIEKFAQALRIPVSEITGEAALFQGSETETGGLYGGSLGALKLLYGAVEGKRLLDGNGGRALYYKVGVDGFILREEDAAAIARSARAAVLSMAEWMRNQQVEQPLREKLG